MVVEDDKTVEERGTV